MVKLAGFSGPFDGDGARSRKTLDNEISCKTCNGPPCILITFIIIRRELNLNHTNSRSVFRSCIPCPHPMLFRPIHPPRLARGIQHRVPVRHFSGRRVIFSGIQPTGTPHLGNYVGAVQRWVRLQDEPAERSDLLYSVVDLHAITMPVAPETLRRHRREAMASLLAAGIDPDRATLFYQSDVCILSNCWPTRGLSNRATNPDPSSGSSPFRADVDTCLQGFYGLSLAHDAVEGK